MTMSTISRQTSPPRHQESSDHPHGGDGDESIASSDSGRLPQRPDRKKVIRPARVPPLELALIHQQLAEMEEYEEPEEEEREPDHAGEDYDEEGEDDDEGRMYHPQIDERTIDLANMDIDRREDLLLRRDGDGSGSYSYNNTSGDEDEEDDDDRR